MSRTEIRTALVEAIKAEKRIFLQKEADALQDTDRLGEDAGLDSVGLLYLVMAIEDAFDVEVDDAEALTEHFRTWGDVLSYVESARS